MSSLAGRAALAGAVVFSGCRSGSPELQPGAPAAERQHGTHLQQAFDANRPDYPPPSKQPPAAPLFLSSFGHAIPVAPIRHPERSVAGRDLCYWVFGDGAETVVVLGGIHGDESSSTEAAYDLVEFLCATPAATAGRKVVVAPEVNPDGNAAATRRNANDIDLNRNFPAKNWSDESGAHGPGPFPGSEPETRFVLTLLDLYAPARVVATHAAAACVNWDGPAEKLADAMSQESGLPTSPTIGYPTPGSLGSYLGVDRAVPTITFELATKQRVGAARDDVRRALIAAITWDESAAGGS